MHRPKELTEELSISAATLRLWSNEFSDFLSPSAQKQITGKGTAAQRRYTDEDITTFRQVKQLLSDGNTYEEIRRRLSDDPPEATERSESHETHQDRMISHDANLALLATHPIVLSFQEALAAKDQVIESKDETIRALERSLEDLRMENTNIRTTFSTFSRITESSLQAKTPPPLRFRWGFLNRLLLESPDQSDG